MPQVFNIVTSPEDGVQIWRNEAVVLRGLPREKALIMKSPEKNSPVSKSSKKFADFVVDHFQ